METGKAVASMTMTTTTAPLSATLPHLIVAQHLRAHGFQATLRSFQADAARAGITLPASLLGIDVGSSDPGVETAEGAGSGAQDGAKRSSSRGSDALALVLIPPELELPNLLAAYNEHQRALAAEAAARAATEALREQQRTERSRLLELTLPGPGTLPYVLHATFRTLHASNILSVTLVQLPVRRFSTVSARFEVTLRPALATTAADRRVVLSDPESGEMLECLEGGQGLAHGHRAAVLSTAQNPVLPRELVSTSMDSTVLVWDLLAGSGAPVQVLKDHARFVVQAAYSHDGRFLATAGYDRKIQIYQREPLPSPQSSAAIGPEGEDDDPEPEPIQAPFKLVKTVDMRNGNPEAIVFLRTRLLPLPDDEDGRSTSSAAAQTATVGSRERTWLAYSTRGECHINYLAMPRIDDQDHNSSSAVEAVPISEQLAALDIGSLDIQKDGATDPIVEPDDWTLVKCNTNENPDDWHVSYSLLSLALHPSGKFLSAQTGDHTRPTSTSTAGESILPPPRILIVQPLRPGRVHTLFLPPSHNAAASMSGGSALNPAPRHAWLRSKGEALWVAGEDGRVRLLDVKSEDGANATQRAEVWTQGRPDDADVERVGGAHGRLQLRDADQEASALWTRGGNTVIKDICVIDDDGSLATCGFDHTVRIVRRRKD
ncbi:unnamed protein product [Tilletia controversa]|uniref:WD40 repeat-like protein n=1 Tax=Tilletia controversa TaxID=13291 RepID=A0A8X7MP31_9BASI|nr:hypothetical protein CF328_g5910 [Tilletia controversa]KAE8242963.1 hypothetical protein A4X06_0g6645 [Tilletia controversa]CAD6928993.1 unnamed protein product [Tilletia controversa]CAD6970981.1 unnamed protein product [Tilletia controversa]